MATRRPSSAAERSSTPKRQKKRRKKRPKTSSKKTAWRAAQRRARKKAERRTGNAKSNHEGLKSRADEKKAAKKKADKKATKKKADKKATKKKADKKATKKKADKKATKKKADKKATKKKADKKATKKKAEKRKRRPPEKKAEQRSKTRTAKSKPARARRQGGEAVPPPPWEQLREAQLRREASRLLAQTRATRGAHPRLSIEGVMFEQVTMDGFIRVGDVASAAKGGLREVVAAYADAGAELDAPILAGKTLLTAAASGRSLGVVKDLLARGARVDAPDHDGATPLVAALADPSPKVREIVRELLARGASPNAGRGSGGQTALHFAARLADPKLVSALLAAGADPLAIAEDGSTAAEVVGHATWLQVAGTEGAKRHKDAKATRELLPTRAAANQRAAEALAAAIAARDSRGVALLLETGVSAAQADRDGITPLLRATELGDADLIDLLVRFGANPNIPAAGSLPLERAARQANTATLEVLLRHGANPNAAGAHGTTALHTAAARGRPDAVVLLLQHGAHVDPRSEDGRTPLMLAAMFSRPRVIELLLRRGANPLAADIHGETPLSTVASMARRAAGRTQSAARKCQELLRARVSREAGPRRKPTPQG